MGSVPHIYRREDLSPGDPNRSCPGTRNHAACLTVSIAVRTKLLPCQQAEFAPKVPHTELRVVVITLALPFHAAEPHAEPGVELLEGPTTGRKCRGEVIRGAPDDSVQFPDHRSVEVVVSCGQLPYLALEFLHGLVPHPPRVGRKMKPQEIIPFPVGGNLRFLRAQTEPEFPQHTLHQVLRLLRLRGGWAEHHEVVGITHEAVPGGVELPVQSI